MSRHYTLDESYFDNIDTPEKAYWLGFIGADGCVSVSKEYRRHQLSVRLASRDRRHLEIMKDDLSFSGPITDEITSNFGKQFSSSRLRICSRPMVEALIGHGIVPRKSLIMKPWCGSDNLMPHYWRGVLDGDGYITKSSYVDNRNGRTYDSWKVGLVGSRDTVKAFQEFVYASLCYDGCFVPKKSIWEASYTGIAACQEITKLVHWLEHPVLGRKREIASTLLTFPVSKSRSSARLLNAHTLQDKYQTLGSWDAVATSIGTTRSSVLRRRRILGMCDYEKVLSTAS